jgi:SSS family transporter
MGVLCTAYTVLGGVEAVIWTDVLQVAVLLGAAIVCVGIIAGRIDGGFGAIISRGMAADKFTAANFTWNPGREALWLFIVGRFFGDFMPNTADQGVIQRYLTVPDLKSARRAAWLGGLSSIPILAVFFFLGTALWVFYQSHPELAPKALELKDDQVLPLFMVQQMPAGVAGLAIAGLFAAAMSSIDSSMNSVSAVVTTDGYRRFRPQATERSCLKLARLVTALTGLVGTGAALVMASYADQIQSLWGLFLGILFLLGSPLAGMFVLGIFTRRANGLGACLGAAVGTAGIFAVMKCTDLHKMLYPVIGLGGCVVTGYLVSLLFDALSNSKPRDLSGLTVHTSNKQA